MGKRVYISADYSESNGDRDVVDELNNWGSDDLHKVDFCDMSKVASGSVSKDPDCRACDLKKEFNKQINASSHVIFVVGDKTASRTAGSICPRTENQMYDSWCTPYKENANGKKQCKAILREQIYDTDDVNPINNYSYLQHEFEQAKLKGKRIVVVYNSLRKESSWLPDYLKDYESDAKEFWVKNSSGEKVGNYPFIKKELGYE